MTPQSIPVSHLFLRPDARRVDPDAVKRLASSIAEIGVLNPLRVRPAERHVNGVLAQAYEVTAGAHRLQAAIDLGLEDLPCVVASDDDLHAELAMIDENLMRAELSPADRAKQVARRKAIYEELHPESKRGAFNQHTAASRQVGEQQNDRFTADTASATGRSERAVQRDAERGEKVADDVLEMVKGTDLDTGKYLDALKNLDPEQQRAKLARDMKPKPKPAKLADEPLNDFEAREKQVAALMSAWNRASPEAREEFMARVDRPVFDAPSHTHARERDAA